MSSVAGPETPPPLNGTRRSSWYGGWLPSWKPTSEEHLEKAEKCILDSLSSEYKDLYVTVGPGAVIRSILLEPDQPQEEEKPPLVLLHGFGCGIPQFYKNLDHLHSDRRLYALDLPGFARSTRVPFPVDAEGAECEFVETLERWREGVGLEQMVLLGHSLGGFLSLSYAMRYPSRVRHLILDDPWGMVSMPPEEEMREKFSVLVRSIIIPIATRFKPFDWIRAFGPLGPRLLKKVRRDLTSNFGDTFMDYVYHSNAQNPTGEEGFYHMQQSYAWARRPMLARVAADLSPDVPVSIIYGENSWVFRLNRSVMELFREARPAKAYLDTHLIRGATHHVHADKPRAFNEAVKHILSVVDSKGDL